MLIKPVDFHIRNEKGHVLALVAAEQLASLGIGEMVRVEDFEGNTAKAMIADIERPRNLVALELEPDSFESLTREDYEARLKFEKESESSEYQKFEKLAKSLVSVPKDDIGGGGG